MATQVSTAKLPSGSIREKLDQYFASIGQGFNAYLERASRMDEIRELNAKSDEELRELGLTRDRIPAHVFRDKFYI